MRSLMIVCLLVLNLGCQGSTPARGPFGTYGPTQIPPPGTGSAGRPDPYYRRPLAQYPANDSPRLSQLPDAGLRRFSSDDERRDARAGSDGPSRNDAAPDGARAALDEDASLDWRPPRQSYRDSSEPRYGSPPRPRFPEERWLSDRGSAPLVEPDGLDDELLRAAAPIAGGRGWDDQDDVRYAGARPEDVPSLDARRVRSTEDRWMAR